MAFQFRLEKVLRVRQELVDQQSRRVGEAQMVASGLEQDFRDLQAQVQNILASETRTEGISTSDLTQRRHWLDHLERSQVKLGEELDRARTVVNLEREKLTEAWRDLEVLKKLKERQKTAWQDEQNRLESRELDEIGQMRSDRARREKLSAEREQVTLGDNLTMVRPGS
jgi:flagellar FliJ protein|nr:flagellar export protein FliJ [Candidatus Krumholzibacteria bacterium]